jgi:hypothetical protein
MTAFRTDLITGGATAVIGAVYYIATFSIQETANIVTPRTFPAIVGIGLIVLGLFVAGQAVLRHRKDTLAEAGPGSRDPHPLDCGGGWGRCGRLGGGTLPWNLRVDPPGEERGRRDRSRGPAGAAAAEGRVPVRAVLRLSRRFSSRLGSFFRLWRS